MIAHRGHVRGKHCETGRDRDGDCSIHAKLRKGRGGAVDNLLPNHNCARRSVGKRSAGNNEAQRCILNQDSTRSEVRHLGFAPRPWVSSIFQAGGACHICGVWLHCVQHPGGEFDSVGAAGNDLRRGPLHLLVRNDVRAGPTHHREHLERRWDSGSEGSVVGICVRTTAALHCDSVSDGVTCVNGSGWGYRVGANEEIVVKYCHIGSLGGGSRLDEKRGGHRADGATAISFDVGNLCDNFNHDRIVSVVGVIEGVDELAKNKASQIAVDRPTGARRQVLIGNRAADGDNVRANDREARGKRHADGGAHAELGKRGSGTVGYLLANNDTR